MWEIAIDPDDLNALSLLLRCLLIANRRADMLSLIELILGRGVKSSTKSVALEIQRWLTGAVRAEREKGMTDLHKARKRWMELDRLWLALTTKNA
jgi:hypothetical protein